MLKSYGVVVVAHKILVSAPVPWIGDLGLGDWGLGLDNSLRVCRDGGGDKLCDWGLRCCGQCRGGNLGGRRIENIVKGTLLYILIWIL